jgi:hypothetical protein
MILVSSMRFPFGIAVLFSHLGLAVAESTPAPLCTTESISDADHLYPYRLFETTNIWTFIQLDTSNGRAWQVNYSVDGSPVGSQIMNSDSLLPEGAPRKNGRFTLYPTKNMYNFLLLDRENGRVWQMQWSFDDKKRGIVREIP